MFGGFYGGSDSEINDSIEKYEPSENSWIKLTISLKTPLWACTAVAISDHEIVILGGKNKNRNCEGYLFDVEEKKLTAFPSMN